MEWNHIRFAFFLVDYDKKLKFLVQKPHKTFFEAQQALLYRQPVGLDVLSRQVRERTYLERCFIDLPTHPWAVFYSLNSRVSGIHLCRVSVLKNYK